MWAYCTAARIALGFGLRAWELKTPVVKIEPRTAIILKLIS